MNVMWYVGKFDEANWNFVATLGLTPTYFAEPRNGKVRPTESHLVLHTAHPRA